MQKTSAGLLMYKFNKNKELEIFIGHPGGPFWKNKDKGAWSIPKGEVEEGEDLLQTAKREFKEETGIDFKEHFIELGEIQQKSGKIVHAWAFEGDWSGFLMGTSFVDMQYPPKSKKFIRFPELDKADFFSIEKAKIKINPAQAEFINRLKAHLEKLIIST